jgi:glycosyltransferase involved in cell wall biosynthesis
VLFSGLYVLWQDPLIVSCLHGAEMFSAIRMRRQADILLHPTWLITPQTLPSLASYAIKSRLNGKRAHFMCCADESDRLLRRWRFPGVLVGLSAYLNERTFDTSGAPKAYDAVYAARMVKYKRLHLAADVKSLFVQTYGEHKKATGEYDLHGYEPAIAHCDFNPGWVSPEDIVAIYNSARVGLALSAIEGAMLASVEYMLCGLPVVSTRCRGGREKFFDPRYVAVVDDTAAAVAEGVAAFVRNPPDPHMVRVETIKKLTVHRERLADYVISVIKRRGATAPGREAMMAHLFEHPEGIKARYVHKSEYEQHGLA